MEHEIRKHVHNILGEFSKRKKSIWKKMAEIFIEMVIIVFAVSFAVFLERQREHFHEQKEVKAFLTGLKLDLLNDINEMKEDRMGYQEQSKWFRYLSKTKQFEKDTLKKYAWKIWNKVHLLVNNGRYEGFKASGKMNTIENTELRNNILDLYQEIFVGLTNNTASYISLKRDFQSLIYQRRRNIGENNDNLYELMKTDEFKNYTNQLVYTNEPIWRYDSAISKSERIIALIDKEYGE